MFRNGGMLVGHSFPLFPADSPVCRQWRAVHSEEKSLHHRNAIDLLVPPKRHVDLAGRLTEKTLRPTGSAQAADSPLRIPASVD